MYRLCHAGNDVFGRDSALDVDGEEAPSLGFQSSAEFAGEAGLPHAALAGEQHMVEVADTGLQRLQFLLAVEEVVAAHPAACR